MIYLDSSKDNEVKTPIPILLDEQSPVALVNTNDVGTIAAELLSLKDPSAYFCHIL